MLICSDMPNILLTNDDGYQAPALAALARALSAVGTVTIFAPDHNWSAAGHTKTMHKPLRIEPEVRWQTARRCSPLPAPVGLCGIGVAGRRG